MDIFKGGVWAVLAVASCVLSIAATGAASVAPAEITALMEKGACVACHQMDARVVGPSWKQIAKKYQGQDAVDLLTQKAKGGGVGVWGEIPMPPNVTASVGEIESVVRWVLTLESSDGAPSEAPAVVEVVKAPTSEDIHRGQDLFQGKTRFENGGASCNSCHDVHNDAVIGGGILAKELTTVFSRLGGAGVRAIIGTPPFPVMQQAYKDKALTEEEVYSLVAFLQNADAQSQFHQPRDYGVKLFISGVGGTVVLFGLCGFIWRGRKKQSVYQEIYDRQTKSE